MNLREQIRKDLELAVGKLTINHKPLTINQQFEVFRPDNAQHGDYSTNVALRLFSEYSSSERKREEKSEKVVSRQARTVKRVYQSPVEFAKELADSLKNQPYVDKLEVKEPGFLNFFITSAVWQEEVEKVLKKEKFESKFSGKKVVVEFTDPNPFKEFHVGHLFSNSVGEAISRLLEAVGAVVKRANYQGDVGLHVAKCLWGMREKIKNQKSKIKSVQNLEHSSLNERVSFLGEAYSLGAREFDENPKAKEEIIGLNRQIYEKLDKIEEYKLGKAWSLENFEAIYKRLGTRFDLYYFESDAGTLGLQIVKKHLGKVFEKSEGAVIFPGEKYGLHNRVFTSSLGLPTYEAKELGLAFRKYKDFAYDQSIIVTGNEIVEYFRVMIAALSKIDPKLASKAHHVAHGMVRMPGGKISSRLGNVISATALLEEAKKRALALAEDSAKGKARAGKGQAFAKESTKLRPGLNLENIAEQVGIGAVKYAFLKGNIGQDIKFSFDEAMSLEGNSGPYLQYTHARCRSVLGKSKVKSQKSKVDFSGSAVEEKAVLSALGHFEETVVSAAENFAPNQVAGFLFEVAQKYNNLYNNLRIIDAKEPDRTRRLFLTESTADIIGKGLNLLGIFAPEKM